MRYLENIEIEHILDKLKVRITDNEEFTESLIKFYLLNHRHRYSKVAKYINDNSINDQQVISFILLNINYKKEYYTMNKKVVSEHIEEIKTKLKIEDDFDYDKFILNIEKLEDHIKLELDRIIYSQIREKNIFSDIMNKFTLSLREANRNLEEKAEKIENNLTSSVISVLGVFSAFVTIFLGGMSAFGSIMTNLQGVSKYRIVFSLLLLGLILFNVSFLLLYSISKILDKNIGKCISFGSMTRIEEKLRVNYYEDAGDVLDFKYIRKRLRVCEIRHPLLFWYNFISIITICFLSIIFIIDYYDCITYIINIIGIDASRNIIPLAVIVTGIIILLFSWIVYLIKARFFKKTPDVSDNMGR